MVPGILRNSVTADASRKCGLKDVRRREIGDLPAARFNVSTWAVTDVACHAPRAGRAPMQSILTERSDPQPNSNLAEAASLLEMSLRQLSWLPGRLNLQAL